MVSAHGPKDREALRSELAVRQSKQWQNLRSFPGRLAVGYLVISSIYILLSDRLLAIAVRDTERLTQIQSYKGWAFVTISASLIFLVTAHFVRSITRVAESLATARLDYRRLLETTHEGVQITDESGRTIFVNDRLCELAGVGRQRLMESGLVGLLADVGAGDTVLPHDEVRLIRPDGHEIWAIVSESPIAGAPGESSGTLRMFTDNTARRLAADELARSLETQRLLLSELDHRVRNNLASLVAMVELSAAGNAEVERFARSVTGRIRVMAAAYTLLSDTRWRPVPLGIIIAELTAPLETRRTIDGPPVSIGMDQVVPLMMVLYELYANARDHGALRSPTGRLDVRWTNQGSEAAPSVVIDWIERGGPQIVGAPSQGFGLAMAEGIAGSELRGHLDCSFSAEGARITLTMALTGHGGWRNGEPTPEPGRQGPAGVPSRAGGG